MPHLPPPAAGPVTIASVEAHAYRVPVRQPIKVSFGTFRDRPMVLVRVTDTDGAVGWGEAWSNWPAVGAEHRARLVDDIAERLIGVTLQRPDEAFHRLTRELEVLAGPAAVWAQQAGHYRVDRFAATTTVTAWRGA